MSYGYGGEAYEADPARLQAMIGEIQAIAKQARELPGGFTSALQPTRRWYGIDDEFAKETGVKYEQTVEGVADTFSAISDCIIGVVEGRLQELQEVRGASSFATDSIDELRRGVDSVGGGGSGGGGGKH
ncbi:MULTISPECIES: hypothetical protein [unclassified Streptomyces]|uniref:hypothetical protein n=1 Tax=unclassified Streptomyces TaxID=2593676 RepID=UPI00336A033E